MLACSSKVLALRSQILIVARRIDPQSMATVGSRVLGVGHWISPITSKSLVSHTKRLGGVTLGADGRLFWLEGRPEEKGRQVLVTRSPEGHVSEVTPPESGFNVRTRVHEYGGGDYIVGASALYFSNFADQRLYAQDMQPDGSFSAPRALTPPNCGCRFADGVVDERRRRLLLVCEDHSPQALQGGQPQNTICAVDLDSGGVVQLVSGSDFYAAPRLSPDGGRLAWVSWDHPNMPWDDTRLWVGDIDEKGKVVNPTQVAGGVDESVMQPAWGPDGSLYFISDAPSGWWNLFRQPPGGKVEGVLQVEGEVGGPAWLFGGQAYQVLSSGKVLAVYSDPKQAGSSLVLVDPSSRSLTPLPTENSGFTTLGGKLAVAESESGITLAAAATSPLLSTCVVLARASSLEGLGKAVARLEVVAESSSTKYDPGYLSKPRVVEFPTEGGATAYMNFYPPRNKDYAYPEGEKPPLLVKIHGGPTSQASTALQLSIQYWTSQGFAVADVNYGGSTGYGRGYRKRLRGSWGVVDVDDCCNAARHLAQQGLVDPQRLCITGGSAGGYTTLACLAFRSVFSAGTSHYGVADLELLAKETHKFESRYLDGLVGRYPEDQELYKERSPIHHVDSLSSPVAFFQGLEDKVVPPNQAELLHSRLKSKGVPTALVMFEGEQHGFRQAQNIRRALDGELFFYAKALGFPAAMPDDVDPITIDNLAA